METAHSVIIVQDSVTELISLSWRIGSIKLTHHHSFSGIVSDDIVSVFDLSN